MKSIIIILISILISLYSGSTVINESNITDYLDPNHEVVADFIIENLDRFTEEYNSVVENEEEKFNAEYCDLKLPAYITTLNQECTYLDFDGNNGFMLVADNYELIAFETEGDLQFLKNCKLVLYSLYDGFGFYNEELEFVSYDSLDMTVESGTDFTVDAYDGQAQDAEGDDGEIINTDKFVKAKYGSGYSLLEDCDVADKNNNIAFDYLRQYDSSFYYEKVNNDYASEGNCALNSAYALLKYLNKTGKFCSDKILSSHNYIDVQNDKFYTKYIGKSNYYIKSKYINEIYAQIREIAINKYGYEVGGFRFDKQDNLIELTAKSFDEDTTLKAKNIYIWSFESTVVKEINKGLPLIWSVFTSSTYGSHSTVVTGYKTYKKTTKIWFIKINKYAKFLKVADNWGNQARYFDFTHFVAFGGFTRVGF